MRAVNLIPSDQRRGGAGAPGRSGSAVYIVLGALAVLVVAAAAYVLTGNQVNSRRSDLAKAQQQATTLEAQAAALKPYTEFASLSQTREQTVASLAASRFDWERTMRELALALPGDVWLTSLVGTVTPGVSFEGAGGGGQNTGSLRSSLQVPALEIVGCTNSQSEVSRVMARLRTMHGVQRVSLASSEKTDSTGGGGSGAASSADCRNGNAKFPQFQLVVFFDAPVGAAATTAPGGAPAGAAPQGTTPQGSPPQGTTQGAPAQGNQSVNQPTSNGSGK